MLRDEAQRARRKPAIKHGSRISPFHSLHRYDLPARDQTFKMGKTSIS